MLLRHALMTAREVADRENREVYVGESVFGWVYDFVPGGGFFILIKPNAKEISQC